MRKQIFLQFESSLIFKIFITERNSLQTAGKFSNQGQAGKYEFPFILFRQTSATLWSMLEVNIF